MGGFEELWGKNNGISFFQLLVPVPKSIHKSNTDVKHQTSVYHSVGESEKTQTSVLYKTLYSVQIDLCVHPLYSSSHQVTWISND